VLSVAQALYFVGASIQLTLTGLVGNLLAHEKSLAILPVTAYVLGSLVSTIPASMFMRTVGRRTGFQIGTLFGHTGAALSVVAIFALDFWLFCLAIFLSGGCQAFVQYYRFAAADTASPELRPKAISWVMAGGLVAAVARPQLVTYTKEAFGPVRCIPAASLHPRSPRG
jgi:MFS family permease